MPDTTPTTNANAPSEINSAPEQVEVGTREAGEVALPDMLPNLSALGTHGAPVATGVDAQAAARARFAVAQQRQKEARARAQDNARKPTDPVAILMLSKSETVPPNLAVWAKWLAETGRVGSKIFIHGKHPWELPPEMRKAGMVRLGEKMEVKTEWGEASLVEASMRMLVLATMASKQYGFSHYMLVSDDTVPLKRLDAIGVEDESQVVGMDQSENHTQLLAMRDALAAWEINNPSVDNWWKDTYARSSHTAYCDKDQTLDQPGLPASAYNPTPEDELLNGRRAIDKPGGMPRDECEAEHVVAALDPDRAYPERHYYHQYRNPQQFFGHSQWWILCARDAELLVQNSDIVEKMGKDLDRLLNKTGKNEHVRKFNSFAADELVIGTWLKCFSPQQVPFVEDKVMAENTGKRGTHARPFDSVGDLLAGAKESSKAPFGRKIVRPLRGAEAITWM